MVRKVLLVIFGIFCFVSSYAEDTKVLFHLNQREKGTLLISSLNNYIATNPDAKVVVVVNSSGVLRFVKNGGLTSDLQSLLEKGIQIGVCNNAIISNNVDANFIIPGVTLLQEGGVAKIVELQKAGYVYIKI